ncbi:phosphatidylserine decarboxylase [Leptobacterium flavescens]|uniref:Phosphatidylserine decarboxylase n=1 Tax=Leptobacterium flavescens TaxID=472055 RepID=A0A6P0UK37_9FLAO|nr:phosphatidylserine decarboxylase [Leptobacterium flavescens]NER13731.1 phosphatidylserine decarboxylase [Leptobacterium flavescens]
MELPVTTYYSDPHFNVFKVPQWRAYLYTFFSVKLWGNLPSPFQRSISKKYSSLFDSRFSRRIIKAYVRFHYKDPDYLDKFKPPNGKTAYESFQDFFTREFRELPHNPDTFVWPCEGLLCDLGSIKDIPYSRVKCDKRTPDTIFGLDEGHIPDHYTFSNVFLHNKNYHRIHAPIDGKIVRIQHIPGDLVVLRPWIYKHNPSLPAFRNERYNIDIRDEEGKIWYLSIVGGPAVGTVELNKNTKLNARIRKLDDLAAFHLGSTCCMASPLSPRLHRKNTFVEVGATY